MDNHPLDPDTLNDLRELIACLGPRGAARLCKCDPYTLARAMDGEPVMPITERLIRRGVCRFASSFRPSSLFD